MNAPRWLALALAAAFAAPVVAQDEGDDEEFAELLDVLSEETEVATKTRMNSDYVPGIVTVLDARTLQATGVRTVWDALSFVPGVETWRDNSATPTLSVRGIPFPFNSGSVQLLIDSVPIAAEAAGINGAALLMPIDQVERIEFVRGPGSVVYGDYAFQGLLNIVTRSEGSAVDYVHGTHDDDSLNLRLGGAGDDWKVSTQLSNYASDDAVATVGRGAAEDRRYAGFNAQRGAWSLVAHAVERDYRSNDGRTPRADFDERSHALEARYDAMWSETLQARFRAQYLSNDIATGGLAFEGGHREAGADLVWTGWSGQEWLAGIEYNHAEIDSALQRPQTPPGRPPVAPVLIGAHTRRSHSVYAQGRFSLTDRLQATLGARHDDNSVIGARVTPRASLVWRLHEHHILKAQYAEGFRSPTFFETYVNPGQPPLDFEVNRTTELNYIFQRPNVTARATLFRSRIDDMVFLRPGGPPSFGNVAMARSDGVELEWSQQFGAAWRIDAAWARSDSRDDRNPQLNPRDIGAAADWIANLGAVWTPGPSQAFGLHWIHAGNRDAAAAGDEEYDRVDLSYTHRGLWRAGTELQFALQNAFDERIVYFSPTPQLDIPVPFERRSAWVRLSWSW